MRHTTTTNRIADDLHPQCKETSEQHGPTTRSYLLLKQETMKRDMVGRGVYGVVVTEYTHTRLPQCTLYTRGVAREHSVSARPAHYHTPRHVYIDGHVTARAHGSGMVTMVTAVKSRTYLLCGAWGRAKQHISLGTVTATTRKPPTTATATVSTAPYTTTYNPHCAHQHTTATATVSTAPYTTTYNPHCTHQHTTATATVSTAPYTTTYNPHCTHQPTTTYVYMCTR